MKKILFTIKKIDVGGVETSLIFLIKELLKKGYKVDLLLEEKGKLANIIPKEVNILYYNDYFEKYRSSRIKKNIIVKKLYKKYKRKTDKIDNKYDVVVAYNGFDNYFDMIAASIKCRKKIIWVHNDFKSAIKTKRFKLLYTIMYKIMSRKFKYFDNIICVSKYTKKNFDSLFKKYNNKTVTIRNTFDFDYLISKSKEKRDIELTGKFNIVSIGRLVKSKNFDKLILITKEIIDRGYNVKTYIIGNGPEYEKINNLISKNNLNDNIILLGSKENPYNILKQADLLVSTSEFESFGNVLIEALALGVPFISNVNSGSKDISELYNLNEKNTICSNNEMCNIIIEKYIENRKKIKSDFDSKKYNEDIMKELNKILN